MKKLVWVFVLVLSFASTAFAQNGGYALKFNGTDGAATMNLNTGNTNSTATLEMWFTQVTAQAGTQFLADLHSISGINRRRVMPYLNSSVIGIYGAPNTGDDNNAITQSTGVTVSTNVWYHIAVTINGSTLKMYVNGKLYVTTSLTTSYALTGTEVLTLATDYWNTTYANIKVDEVRVWSTERTEAQIKANMYKELAGSEAGLLSYYKMSNGSGSSISDNQTAGSYSGTLSGGYSWVASGAFADNKYGLDFDGSNDYVDCGNSASVQRNGTQNFTLEAWVKPTGGVWVAVISKFVHTASNEGYSLEIFSDNKVSLLYGNNWSDWNATTSSTSLTPGVWSHIAGTYDGSIVKVYINGLLSQSATWTRGLTDSGTNLLLGSRSGTTFYSGQMDEVRVWTIARTEAEIRESMCRTLVGNEAGLAAYYRLDQIDGSTTYDLTSNANHGTLTGMDPSTDWVTSDAFNTWIGAESSSWSTAGNWSRGAAPTSSNSVGLYKWALGNEATISTSPIVNNLLTSTAASPTLSSSATINMNFVLGKDFDLNGQTVTLGSTANLVEGNYRLYGTSGTITTTRALSNISSLNVAGLGAKISTTANLGSTTITRGHAQQTGSGNVSILRYYDITPTNNSSLNATLVFNYNDAELNSLTENNLKLFRSTDSGITWTNEGGTVSTANNYVTKTAIPSFSRWTLADSGHPLVLANTTTSVASSVNPSEFGQSVTFTATVNESDPLTPTGTVTFFDGAVLLGSGSLNGSGQATFTTNALSVGAHNITAVYGGDASFNGSTSPILNQTVSKANTTTTITSDNPDPSVVGQAVTVNFTVAVIAPGSGTPTGNVTLSDGTVNCSGPLAGGAGSCNLTFSSPGGRTLTATYAGDANFNGSNDTELHTVNQSETSTALQSSVNPSVFGQSITFTATVTPTGGGVGTPTGSVTFRDGGTALGSGSLAGGIATLNTSTLSVGTHNITAEYGGDANFNGSTSPILSQIVNRANTTTSVVSSLNPSIAGESVTFTATVNVVAPGAGIPTGTVTFRDGTTDLGTGTPNASGQATFNTSGLSGGSHSITAVYNGDSNFNASTSSAIDQVVRPTTVTIPSATGLGDIVLTTNSSGCWFSNVQVYTEAQAGNDPFFSYPYGLVGFTVNCTAADVSITFTGATDLTGQPYRRHGPTIPGDPSTTRWYTYPDVTIVGNTVTLRNLRDGQFGDDTGVDGFIVDQGGPGEPVPTVQVPTMTEWGLLILVLLIGATAMYRFRASY